MKTLLPGFFPATAMPDPDWWEAVWPDPAQVLSSLGVEPDMEVVDLCCGDGLFTAPLARMTRHVIAIDLDPAMLDKARARLLVAGITNCGFIASDAYNVAEIVCERVDFVLLANTFHGVPDKKRLSQAVAAILKQGGHFAVINWHRRPREETQVLGQPRGPKTEMRMEPDDVAAPVEQSGLRFERVVELPPYHYGAIFARVPK
ncbi:MAG TPA: class I SAM-dependent methyltransferase [Xanthobacteraceae bacterium]|nr:class I SAM-dependent methyltransferase [Xanthobacteraceae bacterium]